MSTSPTDLARRRLLASGAGALAAAGLASVTTQAQAQAQAPTPAATPSAAKPLPPYVSWKNPEHLIQHTATTIETKRNAFGTSVITPADRLYIRNNLPAPDASIVANR